MKLATGVLAVLVAVTGAAQAQQIDKVTFATNWVAQAEHGGFYQALADGTYKKHGLDVTILPGGPNGPAWGKGGFARRSPGTRRDGGPLPHAHWSRRHPARFMAFPV